ncbi:alpha/beta fold hydrolase [Streptomyces gardneri]|uniref:Hydrolase n=1 Tax=Streptomyces gardneri TaxID=66892 RepID=A0A4Y3RIQ6_9ACTN|nr:alpha/beta fold hydrolase [Streptomyces gardneri]GEB57636.1 hydrolase [Streptomyces gardneri]GHH02337.1 hydrolase [Streptomyces gardneri]
MGLDRAGLAQAGHAGRDLALRELPVDGATLYFEQRGTGPLLLISQSGEGDAGRTTDLVDALADDFTVLTYDRRGLSRSTLDAPGGPVTMADHVDDAHRLLAHVADGPALMLGCSFGAVIGLHLAAEHGEQLDTLIAHEPVAPWLLDAPSASDAHRSELAHLQDLFATGGLPVALPAIAASLGIDPAQPGAEPGLTPQPMDDRRLANFAQFITAEFTALRTDPGCRDLLRATPTRIVPATGRTTPATVFDHQAAHSLGALIGQEVIPFPGGHNGNTTHPRAWAAHLRTTLHP